MSKLIIITAPSGAGKTTIVRHLLHRFDTLSFSISATTRPRRPYETDGEDYYFLTPDQFRERIDAQAFLEWEEVYPGQFYGTLKSEVERLWGEGKDIVFDIDVNGAMNIKKTYPDRSLAIFIKPPSMDALRERLDRRRTETPENLQKRVEHAAREMAFENKFDIVLVNDHLEEALRYAEQIVGDFLNK